MVLVSSSKKLEFDNRRDGITFYSRAMSMEHNHTHENSSTSRGQIS